MFFDENDVVDFDRADAVADRLMELAKANHGKLVEGRMTCRSPFPRLAW